MGLESSTTQPQSNQAGQDYTTVTEIPGDEVSAEQIERATHRYAWAANLCEGKDLTEVGCGPGLGLGYLGKRAKTVSAGDISSTLVEQAKKHYGNRFEVAVFDATKMPYPDHSKDAVLIFEAIYYLPSFDDFIREVKRVLRPGGVLLITSANKDLYDFNPSPYTHQYFGTVELSQILRSNGFDVELNGYLPVTEVSFRQKVLRPIKKAAVKFNLIPGSMAGKKILKRLVFGGLVKMPAELDISSSIDPYSSLNRLSESEPDRVHKVIYCQATLKES